MFGLVVASGRREFVSIHARVAIRVEQSVVLFHAERLALLARPRTVTRQQAASHIGKKKFNIKDGQALVNKWFHNRLRSFAFGHTDK